MTDSWYAELEPGNVIQLQVLLESANCQHYQPFHSIRVINFFAAVWMICQLVHDVRLSNWIWIMCQLVCDMRLSNCIFCSRFQNFAAFRMLYSFFVWFLGVWILYADVSEHCLFHLHRRCKLLIPPWRWNWQCSETLRYNIQTWTYCSRRFKQRVGLNSKLREATTQWRRTAKPKELIA
jgi:hypothetical protein